MNIIKCFTAAATLIILISCSKLTNNMQNSFITERKQMVELIKNYPSPHKVTDKRVLSAMNKAPRHKFVPEEFINNAYEDGPLPIGYGQTISQPYIVAYMTQMLNLKKTDKVLEVGTGSGYQAAVIAEILTDGHIYTIEIIEPLVEQAKKNLQNLGYKNVTVKTGNGYEGWAKHAPFDAVIVTCAPDKVPPALAKQLKVGGHIAIPVGSAIDGFWSTQKLILITKTKDGLKKNDEFSVRFVPMIK